MVPLLAMVGGGSEAAKAVTGGLGMALAAAGVLTSLVAEFYSMGPMLAGMLNDMFGWLGIKVPCAPLPSMAIIASERRNLSKPAAKLPTGIQVQVQMIIAAVRDELLAVSTARLYCYLSVELLKLSNSNPIERLVFLFCGLW